MSGKGLVVMARKKAGGGIARMKMTREAEKAEREAKKERIRGMEILVTALRTLDSTIDIAYTHVSSVQRAMLHADDCGAYTLNPDDDWSRLNLAHHELARIPTMLDRLRSNVRARIVRVQEDTTKWKRV